MRPLLLCALALLALSSPAHAAVQLGIADQKATMFGDPRFGDLAIKHARLNLAWDWHKTAKGRATANAWFSGAKAGGIAPLVTFDRSTRRPSYNPTPAEMVTSLRTLRREHPFVKAFATWNEANINKNAAKVARWWLALRKARPTCTVLGADLLDRRNAGAWAKRFVKAAKRTPKVWGLHNYTDANLFRTTGTRAVLAAVKGDIWFTETGGVVKRRNGSTVRFAGTGVDHAAKATQFVFDKLIKLSPRVRRVYLYHWDAPTAGGSWDSAFIGPDGAARPALDVVAASQRGEFR